MLGFGFFLATLVATPAVTVATPEAPVRLLTNTAGRVTADFGRDAFGWLEFDAPMTGRYFVVLGEKLNDDGTVERHYGGTVRATAMSWTIEKTGIHRVPLAPDLRNSFSAKEGSPIPVRPEFGVILPFRAVEFFDLPFDVSFRNVRRQTVSVPANRAAASFSCDDARLDRVYDFCRHTMFATTFAGLFVDGDRERIPYEADAYVSQLNWYAVSDDFAFPRRTLAYLATHPTWPTEFKQCLVSSAWADWMWTGETSFIERHYDLLKEERLLSQFCRATDGLLVTGGERSGNALTNRLGAADIVDWPRSERDGFVFRDVNAVVNAFRYRNLREMADIARALDKAEESDGFSAEADRLRVAFNRVFFDEKSGLYRDGEGTDHASVHANAMALCVGLVPPERVNVVADWLVERGMACSVYFSQYLLEALFRSGRAEAAVRLLTADGNRSWLGMLDQGATMTMEAWNMEVKSNQDWNHAWGAVPLNILTRFVVGVTPLSPGFGCVSVAPQLGSLRRFSARVPTPQGSVTVTLADERLEVSAPVGARVDWCGRVHEVPPGCHVFEGKISKRGTRK